MKIVPSGQELLKVNDTCGRLTVIGQEFIISRSRRVVVMCKCGNTFVGRSCDIARGKSTSCGCLHREQLSERVRTHGDSRNTKLYWVWQGMKKRCTDPKHDRYDRYGGRGIAVCREWSESYEAFKGWAIENGYSESLTIDRIDNDGMYCPDNCRWVTGSQQSWNKSTTIMLTAFGETKSLRDWLSDKRCSVSQVALYTRIIRGWNHPDAITLPHKSKKPILAK